MARFDGQRVPRGTSRRWEVIVSDEQTDGSAAAPPEATASLTALDVRSEHRVLQSMSESQLAAIPLLREGERLARYGDYLDLHDPARADFRAEGDEVVRPGQRIVARTAVARELWDDLLAACAEVTGARRRRSA